MSDGGGDLIELRRETRRHLLLDYGLRGCAVHTRRPSSGHR